VIITFSKLGEYREEYQKLAETIALWTTKHMQHSSGHFYYQVHPHYKIKIPYMRWSQAWMMLAFTELQKNISK
jgi:hypothetical protein